MWDVTSEVTGVEVALETANGNDKFGVPDWFPNFRSTNGANIDLQDGILTEILGRFEPVSLTPPYRS